MTVVLGNPPASMDIHFINAVNLLMIDSHDFVIICIVLPLCKPTVLTALLALLRKMLAIFPTEIPRFCEGFSFIDMIKLRVWCGWTVGSFKTNRQREGFPFGNGFTNKILTEGAICQS